jgi:plasmid stabilization system protein ParE
MKVYWTQEARARLLNTNLHNTVLTQSSTPRHRTHSATITPVASPPLEGRRLPEYPKADVREVLERPFRLIYLVKPDQIEIITVKHYRQRLPRSPKRLQKQ